MTYDENAITKPLLELFGNKLDMVLVAPKTMVQHYKMCAFMCVVVVMVMSGRLIGRGIGTSVYGHGWLCFLWKGIEMWMCVCVLKDSVEEGGGRSSVEWNEQQKRE